MYTFSGVYGGFGSHRLCLIIRPESRIHWVTGVKTWCECERTWPGTTLARPTQVLQSVAGKLGARSGPRTPFPVDPTLSQGAIFKAVEDLRAALGETYIDLEVNVARPGAAFDHRWMEDGYGDTCQGNTQKSSEF